MITRRQAITSTLFGTGYLGRLHARILTEMPEAEVAGFVETDDAIAAEVTENLKLTRFESVEALAREIDCAVVATPTMTHCDVARQLIEAGCDVMVEKPIAAAVDEAQRLIDLVQERASRCFILNSAQIAALALLN